MLARLQRVTTLLLVLGAALVTFALWHMGFGMWSTLGGVAALFVHAWVLAAEFLLMARVNAASGAPPARWRQVLSAWCGEVFAGLRVFAWRQPFFSHAIADSVSAPKAKAVSHRGQRGVLLVHGFVCNRGLWNPWLRRLATQGRPFIAVTLEPVFGSIDDYMAAIEDGIRRLEGATGEAPVMVAHSMGGLVARCWLAKADNHRRVHHVLTLGTPHNGTWLARWALSTNGRQMQLGSHWQTALFAVEQARGPQPYRHFTCFWGHCDNIVFPARSATLPGADNRHLTAVAHVQMVHRPEPFEALTHLLDRSTVATPNS